MLDAPDLSVEVDETCGLGLDSNFSSSADGVDLPSAQRGLMWTPVSVRHYDGRVEPGADPTGHELFWFAVVPIKTTEQ